MTTTTPVPTAAAAAAAVDWDALVAAARGAAAHASCEYSSHAVGAAGLDASGRVHLGCNVENAAYLALHAEWNMVGALTVAGGGALVAVVCVVGRGHGVVTVPCGICRQVLFEAGGPDLAVLTPAGPATLAELLPHAFGPANLAGLGR